MDQADRAAQAAAELQALEDSTLHSAESDNASDAS